MENGTEINLRWLPLMEGYLLSDATNAVVDVESN